MKKYKFCYKPYKDEDLETNESIGSCSAPDLESAVEIFSRIKQLSPQEFLKIFKVLEVDIPEGVINLDKHYFSESREK